VTDDRRLIIELPRGGAVERQLSADPPPSLVAGDIVVTSGPTDAHGNLEAPSAGEVVLSLPSPEALTHAAGEVRRVIDRAGAGIEPLVVLVEAADELREDELAVVIEAAAHAHRAVILRIVRSA
jgi:hypothetical protein